MSNGLPLSSPTNDLSIKEKTPPTTLHPVRSVAAGFASQDPPHQRFVLPTTRQNSRSQIICYDYLGRRKTHEDNQRYVSPTTGACRKLVVQAVNPSGPNEKHVKDHADTEGKIALWLSSTSPFQGTVFFKWIGSWVYFALKLLWPLVLLAINLWFGFSGNNSDDSNVYNTGSYKPFARPFRRQFWAASSPKEYTVHVKGENVPTHSLHPRLLMVRESGTDRWSPCTDPIVIKRTKFIAISFCAGDMNFRGPDGEKEEWEFIQEVRAVVAEHDFDAYWVDLECLGETPEEKKLDLYCMADVYRGAEITLIMLGDTVDGWRNWGGRVWTLPEALLSRRLYYKVRRQSDVYPISLHQLGNLAYEQYDLEQAIVNAYSGKDPLERLERLTLLKSAIWRRGITSPTPQSDPSVVPTSGPHPADRVYALMGFFEHRIQPDYLEDDLRALARLSMANDNDRIAERMVSLLPPNIRDTACWYADDDIYSANLWNVTPEIQVAGITETGALVLDGCKAACIRWKDFPDVACAQTNSIRRTVVLVICYLAWPSIIIGAAVFPTTKTGGTALFAIGLVILAFSPWLFVFSQSGRVQNVQPWLVGVKGVMSLEEAAVHLFGGGVKGRYRRLDYTPTGSMFAVPEKGRDRSGAAAQYALALSQERGAHAGRMYTLVDTCSSTIYYFSAERAPTVCLFTGREGGLGRFVLCSERCEVDELHKETVLRMPTYISQRMDLCDWVALG